MRSQFTTEREHRDVIQILRRVFESLLKLNVFKVSKQPKVLPCESVCESDYIDVQFGRRGDEV